MATFKSKEDGARNQVPLHRFQERVGAFRAVIHMIANRAELEPRILGTLQASLHKVVSLFLSFGQTNPALIFGDDQEEGINRMISDAEAYEDNQGMEGIPDDSPSKLSQSQELMLTGEKTVEHERARQDNVRKRKQRRVRKLLASLNGLSADLFATISVAERQIAVLQDLHSVFATSYRTKTRGSGKGYPSRRNPFYQNVAPIPILSENPEQIWPDTLDTIDEVVQERKSFIQKVKELVENMDVRRKIV